MLWRTLPKKRKRKPCLKRGVILLNPVKTCCTLWKKCPLLESRQREVLRIVRKVSQYFYPQKQTRVMNEGWATFWHYTILNHLYDEGKVTERFMLEFLHSHTNVVFQPPYNSPWYSGINPYALGFAMFGTSNVFVSLRPRKINTGSRISPVLTGWKPCTSRCVILKMRALSASSCHRR